MMLAYLFKVIVAMSRPIRISPPFCRRFGMKSVSFRGCRQDNRKVVDCRERESVAGGEYDSSASAPRYDRRPLGAAQAASARRRGQAGRPAHDNRRFIDAVCWILRTGSPWRDLPPDYGDWKNTHRRFCRWRDRGVWAGLLDAVIDDPDFEWLMIHASYIKAHPHSAGARGLCLKGRS